MKDVSIKPKGEKADVAMKDVSSGSDSMYICTWVKLCHTNRYFQVLAKVKVTPPATPTMRAMLQLLKKLLQNQPWAS